VAAGRASTTAPARTGRAAARAGQRAPPTGRGTRRPGQVGVHCRGTAERGAVAGPGGWAGGQRDGLWPARTGPWAPRGWSPFSPGRLPGQLTGSGWECPTHARAGSGMGLTPVVRVGPRLAHGRWATRRHPTWTPRAGEAMNCRMANTVNAVTHSLYYDRVNSAGAGHAPGWVRTGQGALWIMKPGAVPAQPGRRGTVRTSRPPTVPLRRRPGRD